MNKYKKTDGSGIVFNTLEDAVDDFCKGKSCEACPLDKAIGDDTGFITCCDWAELYQTEAAELMGLEIIREEPLEVNPATNLVQKAQEEEPEQETVVRGPEGTAPTDDTKDIALLLWERLSARFPTHYWLASCDLTDAMILDELDCAIDDLRLIKGNKPIEGPSPDPDKNPEAALPPENRHWEICRALNELYKRKNHDYGDSFHQSFVEEGMAMARIRLGDKLSRFKALTRNGGQQVADESIRDTLIDLANYAIMTVMEMDGEE